MLVAILNKKSSRAVSLNRVRILGVIISCLILAGFVATLFFGVNLTLLVFGSFLLITSIIKDKDAYYSHIGIIESKTNYINRGLKMRSLAVPADMPLYKLVSSVTPDSLTEFTVIDANYQILGKINELDLQRLIQIYPANTHLKLIIS